MPSPIPAQNAPTIPRIPQLTGLVLLVVAAPSRVSVGSPKMWWRKGDKSEREKTKMDGR